MQIAQGGTHTFTAQYTLNSGELVDPVNPRVSLLDTSGDIIVNDAEPVRDELGLYQFEHEFALDAELGQWTVRWTGTINGSPVASESVFDVVIAGSIDPINAIVDYVRDKIGDRVTSPPGAEMYTSDQIRNRLSMFGNNYDLTIMDFWESKAAYYSHMIDIAESGAERKLSQLHRHAIAMFEMYRKKVKDTTGVDVAPRVAGKGFNYLNGDNPTVIGYERWPQSGQTVVVALR